MPAREKLCNCKQCLGINAAGCVLSKDLYRSHQARAIAQHQLETQDALVFSAILTDEGPSSSSQQLHPLWSGKQPSFQAAQSSHIEESDQTLESLTRSLGWLVLHSDNPNAEVLLPATSANRVEDPISAKQPQPSPTQFSLSCKDRSIRKRERNQHTVNILARLDQMERSLDECQRNLSASPSRETLQVEKDLGRWRGILESIKRCSPSIDLRKKKLIKRITDIEASVSSVKELFIADASPLHYITDHHFGSPVDNYDEVAQVSMFLALSCTVILGISQRIGNFILRTILILLKTVFRNNGGSLRACDAATLQMIPSTLRTVLLKFNLEGHFIAYCVCPTCHYTYAPTFQNGSETPLYPDSCTNKPKPDGSICSEPLLTPSGEEDPELSTLRPLKVFLYHDLKDYLAGLLSRRDIEELIDKACDDTIKQLNGPQPEFWTNSFDAEFVRSFKGPKGDKLFIHREDDVRLLFSLNVDFFHPEGMRIHGATASCGIISMACLNLPLDICYKPENMYIVGIIPGPHEPHLTDLNHYLRPLIDDLEIAYKRGIYLSRTAGSPDGRLLYCAIAAGVHDLPAARKTAQLANHNSHLYCTVCECRGLSTRGDTNYFQWKKRNTADMRSQAIRWKNAVTSKEQERIFHMYGVRWSELWCLPYWDPSSQLVVDSMHCLLEGLVANHVRNLLKLTSAEAAVKPKKSPAFHYDFRTVDVSVSTMVGSMQLTPKEAKQISKIHLLLVEAISDPTDAVAIVAHSESLQKRLLHHNTSALQFVCQDLDCMPHIGQSRVTKARYITALVEWRKSQPWTSDMPTLPQIITPAVIKRIQSVIREMVVPSWLSPVPRNYGEAAAGTLKADEWRTLAMLHLPVALISLWGYYSSLDTIRGNAFSRETLDHSMLLFTAVRLATMRTMTVRRMTAYRDNILSYIDKLKILYPDMEWRTNYHMAVHIYDFLRLYGPVKSWWCFPFERLIGILQRLPTNHKHGELEATMLKSFIRGARLRRWLGRPNCPPAIKECKNLFDDIIQTRRQVSDSSSLDSTQPFPPDLASVTKVHRGKLHALLHYDNVVYARSSTHLGNSLIMYYTNSDTTLSPIPGSIQYIFNIGEGIKFAVRCQCPLSEGVPDPFASYPHFPAQLHMLSLEPSLEIIEPNWVTGHYARWALSEEHAVVVTLQRD